MVLYTGAKMMNIVAIGMLVWSLGAAMVLSPEPILPGESSHPLSAAKEASKQSVGYAADAARKTGEGIRQTVASGMQSTGDVAHSAMETLKDTSQAGLEKIGLATPPQEKSTFENWESGLQAAKERAAAAVRGAQDYGAEAADKAKQSVQEKDGRSAAEIAREKFENLRKYGQMEPPSTTEVIRDKTVGAYETTKEAAGDAARAVKDTVAEAGEKIQGGAHSTFITAEEAAEAAKDKLGSATESVQKKTGETLGYGGEKSSESAESVSELASKMAQSVQENVNAAGSKAYNTAGSAKESAYETMGAAYDYAADSLKDAGGNIRSVDESKLSYQEKLKLAAEQAADMLRHKAKEAGNYMPNVGQGLSLGEKSDSDLKQKASGYMESAKDRAGDYYENAKDTAGDYYSSAKETIAGGSRERPANWREVFLNGLGIREEADLSKFDVLVGQIYGYWNRRDWTSPGLFQKAGEAWNHATTATEETARTMKNKVSEGFYNVGDHVRHTKENVAEKANHVADKASGAFHSTKNGVEDGARDAAGRASDTLPRTGSKLNYTVFDSSEEGAKIRPSYSLLRWIGYSTIAWILSSIKAGHLLSFSSTYGSSLWVTFVSGYLLSKALSRQQFGVVQSKLFPIYLRLIAAGQALCLLTYMMSHPWTRSSGAEKLQYLNLWAVFVSTLVNMFFLEPRATKVMFEKMKIEKEEGSRAEEEAKRASDLREGAAPVVGARKAQLDDVNRNFNVLHGWSSTFNLIGLMGETWHLWHLSRALAW